MKKGLFLSVILTMAIVFGSFSVKLPVYANSGDGYKLWLGDTEVTNSNYNDILGDGTARFNPATKTLTLNHPNIKGVHDGAQLYIALSGSEPLTIKGFADFLNKDADYGILAVENDIILNGVFDIYGKKTGILGWDCSSIDGYVHIVGEEEYGIDSDANVYFSWGFGVTEVEGGIEAVRAEDSIGIGATHDVYKPEGGYYDSDERGVYHIYDKNGNIVKYAKIGPCVNSILEAYYIEKVGGTDSLTVDITIPKEGETYENYSNGYVKIDLWEGKSLTARSYWSKADTGKPLGVNDVIEAGVEYKLQIYLSGNTTERGITSINEFKAGSKISENCYNISFNKVEADDEDNVVLTAYYKIPVPEPTPEPTPEPSDDKKQDDKSDNKKNDSSDKKDDNKKEAKKYSDEWVNGKWYNSDGTQTYDGTLSWKQDATGWWVEDSYGWYPTSQWQRIDGKWYYFCADGYMDYSEYREGCWLGADGAWDEAYSGGRWMSDSTGWWYTDASGWYPQSQWVWIDGSCYYFGSDGYMLTNQYVDGCWLGADGAWVK